MTKKSLFSQKGGLPEIIEIEIEHEVSGFEHVVLERLLDSFNIYLPIFIIKTYSYCFY